MNKKTIILITGKKGSGKSYLAEHLVKELGAERYAFAGCIKRIAANIEKETGVPIEGNKEKVYRTIMQEIGNSFRGYELAFWINKTVSEIKESDNDIFVIDDCRFKNELKAFDEDFDVVRVRSKRKSIYPSGDTDASEIDLDDIPDMDFEVVYNEKHDLEFITRRIKDSIKFAKVRNEFKEYVKGKKNE